MVIIPSTPRVRHHASKASHSQQKESVLPSKRKFTGVKRLSIAQVASAICGARDEKFSRRCDKARKCKGGAMRAIQLGSVTNTRHALHS
jgi:hypothetical protein